MKHLLLLLWLLPGTLHAAALLGPAIVEPGQSIHARATAQSKWQLTDVDGRMVASGIASVTGTIETAPLPAGYFELSIAQPGAAPQRFALAGIAKPSAAPSRYGAATHFAQNWPLDLVPLLRRIGITRVRDELYWHSVERAPGRYALAPGHQAYVDALSAADIRLLLVLSFGNPLHDQGEAPYTTDGRAAFARYAEAVVALSGSLLDGVEVWNEYNGSFCKGHCAADRPGTYAAMLAEVSASLRRSHPDLPIGGGAAVGIPLPWFDQLGVRGAFASMDAAVIHPYRLQPAGVDDDIARLRGVFARHGSASLPVWVTETGQSIPGEAQRPALAAYLGQQLGLLALAGVDRVYWYPFRDEPRFPFAGLVRRDGDPLGRHGPTPALVAYATIIRMLAAVDHGRKLTDDPALQLIRFERPQGPLWMLWAPRGDINVTLTASQGSRTSLWGETVPLASGRTPVTVGPAPMFLETASLAVAAPALTALLADNVKDFSLEQGKLGWSYGAVDSSGRFEPLRVATDAWGSGWRHPAERFLSLRNSAMHPGSRRGVVLRWTARQAVHATLHVDLIPPRGKHDGMALALLIDGRPIRKLVIDGQKPLALSLPVETRPGTRIDIQLLPGTVNAAASVHVSLRQAEPVSAAPDK